MGENEEPDEPPEGTDGPRVDPGDNPPQGEAEPAPAAVQAPDGGRFGARRSAHDRHLGGVAGGLASALGVDPIVVRVGLVVVTLWWPVTPLIYCVVWLVIPEEGAERSLLRSWRAPGRMQQVGGIAALGVGASALAPSFGDGDLTDARVGLLLVVIGSVLVMGRWGDDGSDRGPGAGAQDERKSETGADRPGAMSQAPIRPGAESAPQAKTGLRPTLPLPNLSGALGWFCLWLVLLLAVGAVALDRLGATVQPGVVVSLALLVVAIGLLIATVRGRAPILVPVGLVLVPVWLAFAAGDVPRYDGDGTVTYRPRSLDDLGASYTHGYGTLLLDLTQMELRPGQTIDLEAGVTAGKLRLRVPRDVAVDVDVTGGLASAELWNQWEGDHTMSTGNMVTADWPRPGGMDLSAPAKAPFCDAWEVWYRRVPGQRWVDDAGTQLSEAALEQARADGRVVKEPVDEAVEAIDSDRAGANGAGDVEHLYPGDLTYDAAVILQAWATPDGESCTVEPPPTNPARLNIDATIGFGTLELEHVETPA